MVNQRWNSQATSKGAIADYDHLTMTDSLN